MTDQMPPEAMIHPELGKLPARRLLECVFALSPDGGPILHHHLEELDVADQAGAVIYTVNGKTAHPERSRCQVIPPLIPQFPSLD